MFHWIIFFVVAVLMLVSLMLMLNARLNLAWRQGLGVLTLVSAVLLLFGWSSPASASTYYFKTGNISGIARYFSTSSLKCGVVASMLAQVRGGINGASSDLYFPVSGSCSGGDFVSINDVRTICMQSLTAAFSVDISGLTCASAGNVSVTATYWAIGSDAATEFGFPLGGWRVPWTSLLPVSGGGGVCVSSGASGLSFGRGGVGMDFGSFMNALAAVLGVVFGLILGGQLWKR
jgi:hypothetical protein